ncbi:hypothetical protein ACFYZ2_39370 [Streptomyces sviceus]|uniref:hypothetical protein n=1 Tax=Streptomyces sviceus TaxID=285530 RepID=UPI003676DCD2
MKAGDVLQPPTGTAEVTGVRLYHANTTTYDLTIGSLHTYYVQAGAPRFWFTIAAARLGADEDCSIAYQGRELTDGICGELCENRRS